MAGRSRLLWVVCPAVGLGCRWTVYIGKREAEAEAIFLQAEHSLVRQSFMPSYVPFLSEQKFYRPSEVAARNHELNRDGWGLGYGSAHDLHVHRSARGATDASNQTDPDIVEVSQSVRSSLLFGHLRAATDGDANELNSHPFWFGRNSSSQVLWMHNGGLSNYHAMLERLRGSDAFSDLLGRIKGGTDSELAGALFVDFLRQAELERGTSKAEAMRFAMKQTLHELNDDDDDPHMLEVGERMCPTVEAFPGEVASSMNFAASDGETLVATRFRTCGMQEPPTLYYALGSHLDADGVMRQKSGEGGGEGSALLVSSEPLFRNDETDGSRATWKLLAKDQMLLYDRGSGKLQLECLSEACEDATASRREL